MPIKRVVVHAACTACGNAIALGGVVASVNCESCARTNDLDPMSWRWIFAGKGRAAPAGARIGGESEEAVVTCPCGATIAEERVAAAFASHQTTVSCPACARDMPLRPLGPGYLLVDAAVVGEGLAAFTAPVQVNTPCVSCGAPLMADGSTRMPACAFCGTRTPLPEDVWRALPHPPRPFYVWTKRLVRSSTGWSPRVKLAVASSVPIALGIAVLGVLARARGPRPTGLGTVNGPCAGSEWACSRDGKAQLRCSGDRFVVAMTCKGPKGCRLANAGSSVSCDYTLADVGDPCAVSDSSCSTDHKALLHCDGSNFSVVSTCKGPGGCSVTPHEQGATLSCDDHVAAAGELCEGDDWACSEDRKEVFLCRLGKFVPLGTCRGPKGCVISKNPAAGTTSVLCDSNIAMLGDLCQHGHACSSDGKSLLACEDSHFAVSEQCPRGCTFKDDKLTCRR